MAIRRRAFRDDLLQARFERDGFVVVRIDDASLVERARAAYATLPDASRLGFQSSLQVPSAAYRRASVLALAPLAEYAIRTWLDRYRSITLSYVCKLPGETSRVVPHQDWSFVDETRCAALNIWCPLVDVDRRNGALHLLKGSHRLPFTIRGTGTPFAFEQVVEELTFDRLQCLPLRAGEAVIYDVRMLHASPANAADAVRVAAGIAAIPDEEQQLHYFQNPSSGRLERYAVDDRFWEEYVFGQPGLPACATLIGPEDGYVCPSFTLADVAPLFGTGRAAS